MLLCLLAHLAKVELRGCLLLRLGRYADVGGADAKPIGHDHGTPDDVFQLAHVPGPGMGFDRGDRIRKQGHRTALHFAAEAMYESMREKCRIPVARAQRRDLQDDLGQPVV